jgi:hypothetical protein
MDSDPTNQKSSGYLTGSGWQPRKVDFTHCLKIFWLRGGSSRSEDSLEVAVAGKHVCTSDGVYRIGVDFAGDCPGKRRNFFCIKRVIEADYAGEAVGIRLDIGSGSIAIPIDSNRMLVLDLSAESLKIPDWIEVIHADDFRFCPNLQEVIAGLQREIDGFRNCRKLKCLELSWSVEIVGKGAFSPDEDDGGRGTEAKLAHKPLFPTAGDEAGLRRRRRGCHVFIARKGPETEENRQTAVSGII